MSSCYCIKRNGGRRAIERVRAERPKKARRRAAKSRKHGETKKQAPPVGTCPFDFDAAFQPPAGAAAPTACNRRYKFLISFTSATTDCFASPKSIIVFSM